MRFPTGTTRKSTHRTSKQQSPAGGLRSSGNIHHKWFGDLSHCNQGYSPCLTTHLNSVHHFSLNVFCAMLTKKLLANVFSLQLIFSKMWCSHLFFQNLISAEKRPTNKICVLLKDHSSFISHDTLYRDAWQMSKIIVRKDGLSLNISLPCLCSFSEGPPGGRYPNTQHNPTQKHGNYSTEDNFVLNCFACFTKGDSTGQTLAVLCFAGEMSGSPETTISFVTSLVAGENWEMFSPWRFLFCECKVSREGLFNKVGSNGPPIRCPPTEDLWFDSVSANCQLWHCMGFALPE